MGEGVRDLQVRLGGLGFATEGDEPGVFGPATDAALRAFQAERGLRIDGVCGEQSWSAVVEAGWHLGERLLYYTTPMLRGDDVAGLQRRLGQLGFDAGRVDGIFGERAQAALLDFQRNAGLTTDAVCGPATLATLDRLGAGGRGDPVEGVRERAALRETSGTLRGQTLVVGENGGLDALAGAVARVLVAAGATVVTLHQPDESEQAAQANAIGAAAYLGLAAAPDAGCTVAYYAAHGFESAGGRRLAECLQSELPGVLGGPAGGAPGSPTGMSLAVLRETRMPAVVCELGPPTALVEHGARLAAACERAFTCWVEGLAEV
ncbi:MAG: putative peptidoglycan-binding protein [Acidimicrobiales bacterium]|jgi:N-acetylmuramoyl-L-alanine amidase|nr:putative peptidoglycan-binding protein [Acidimicrobiales bacterium]